MKKVKRLLFTFLFYGLPDILQQIFTGFETDAEADRRIRDRHLRSLLRGEETEDGGSGMDGQRLSVEEVRGATDDLELVDKSEGGFFRF